MVGEDERQTQRKPRTAREAADTEGAGHPKLIVPKKGGAGREHRDESRRMCEHGRREGPRNCIASDVEGVLVVDEAYKEGLGDIEPGQRIVIIFNFHESPAFSPDLL